MRRQITDEDRHNIERYIAGSPRAIHELADAVAVHHTTLRRIVHPDPKKRLRSTTHLERILAHIAGESELATVGEEERVLVNAYRRIAAGVPEKAGQLIALAQEWAEAADEIRRDHEATEARRKQFVQAAKPSRT